MEIRRNSVTFGQHQGSGPRTLTRDVTFSTAPTQAEAILTGFDAQFSPGDGDHHLGNIDVRLETQTMGTTVRVEVTYGLRDWSGEWDDQYEGQIFFSVIAD